MRLYSSVVSKDRGLAPNPFWGYCTVAVCTPNHMGIRAQVGDWLIGTEPVNRGSKLVYAMQVAEKLPFEGYYNDPRFERKKPDMTGTWRQRCGDNIYCRVETGGWTWLPSLHTDPALVKEEAVRRLTGKDLRYPYVFIAERFYYFGEKAVEIPPEYADLIWKRQGCKCNHEPDSVRGFLDWLQTNFKPGIHGEPRDNLWRSCS